MRAEELAKRLLARVKRTVENDRPKLATVTVTTNRSSTGEIECTLTNGSKVWVDASSFAALSAGDMIWVNRLGAGFLSSWLMTGFKETSGGSHDPVLRTDVLGGTTLETLTIAFLTDNDGNVLSDNDGDVLYAKE